MMTVLFKYLKLFPNESIHMVGDANEELNLSVKTYVNGIRMDFNSAVGVSRNTPTLDFLTGSLVQRPNLRKRHSVYYLTTHSWRKDIKKYQISAIKNSKFGFSYQSVEMVCDDILSVLVGFMGELNVDYVVGMPCSHSPREKCFSTALSICIANKLNTKWLNAFEMSSQTGSSHPAKNANRPSITLKARAKGTVLLIDDVVTSGDHVEEAVKVLRDSAKTVFAVGWIGGVISGDDALREMA